MVIRRRPLGVRGILLDEKKQSPLKGSFFKKKGGKAYK